MFSPEWEGLFLLNPTASWIWLNADDPNLPASYALHFGIPLAQAERDVRLTFESWSQGQVPFRPQAIRAIASEIPYQASSYRLNGKTFQISFATREIAAELIPRLEQIEEPTQFDSVSSPGHTFHLSQHSDGTAVYRDGTHIGTESLVTGARAILLQELTRLAVPGREFTLILHAGAVGNQDRCVILAGASFSGKSTLCAALMQSGLLCYSDDSACLTTDFEVAGMPFALSLRESSWPLFPGLDHRRFLTSNLNGTSPSAVPIALIFVEYRAEVQSTTLESVGLFDALVALQESGFWVKPTKPAIAAVLDWLSRLPIHRLRYSALHEAVEQVRSLL